MKELFLSLNMEEKIIAMHMLERMYGQNLEKEKLLL